MLSDEEKEAIDLLEQYLNFGNKEGVLCRNLRTIYTIIEKQSKEIEELKEDSCCMTNCVRRDKEKLFLEDKIKAKIEEYDDKGMTVNLANRSAGKTFQQAVHYEVKKVLQSLLEKE